MHIKKATVTRAKSAAKKAVTRAKKAVKKAKALSTKYHHSKR